MKTIYSVMDELTNSQKLMEDIKTTLRTIDPDYPEEEAKFNTACALFLQKAAALTIPSPAAYLQAHELDFVSSIIYIAGQGFKLNLDIFNHPVHALLLQQCDFEDLNRERMLDSVPGVQEAQKTIDVFHNALRQMPESTVKEIRALTDEITSMYSYLKTFGYKLAHYFGFILADHLLPYVLPGYRQDPINTTKYHRKVTKYLKIDLDKLLRT